MYLKEAIKVLNESGYSVLKENEAICKASYFSDFIDDTNTVNVEVYLKKNDGSDFTPDDTGFIYDIYEKIVDELGINPPHREGVLSDAMYDGYNDGEDYIAKLDFFFDADRFNETQAKEYIAKALTNQNITAVED